MKTIKRFNEFKVNEGIFSTIKKAVIKNKDLDDVVERIFNNIRNDFNYNNVNYEAENTVQGFDGEFISYKFNDKDEIKIGVQEEEETSMFDGGEIYTIHINNDEITNDVSIYLIRDIYDFLIEQKYKKKKSEQDDIKNKYINKYK